MRIDNWESALNAVFEEWRSEAFEPEVDKTPLFIMDTIGAITATDVAAELNVDPTVLASAAGEAMLQERFHTAEAFMTALLGPSKPPLLAERGDIVLLEIEDSAPGLGVHDGQQIIALAGDRSGLVSVPVSTGMMAWSVGS